MEGYVAIGKGAVHLESRCEAFLGDEVGFVHQRFERWKVTKIHSETGKD